MKKFLTLIIAVGLALTIQAQDITNTMTANGSFKVNNNNGTTMFEIENDVPYVYVGDTKNNKTHLYSRRDLNIVKEKGTAGLNLYSYKSNGFFSEDKISLFHARGTIASPLTVNKDEQLGSLTWYGYNGNWDKSRSASIEVEVGTVTASGSSPGNLIFSTVSPGSNILSPRMTIKDDGTVDISTSVNIGTFMHLTPGSAPASPNEGDVYMDASTHKLRCYDGSAWQDLW